MSCQVSWSTSPWSSAKARLPRGLELWGEGGPGIPSGATLPRSVPEFFPAPVQSDPPASGSMGQNSWNLAGASRNVAEN